MNYSEQILRARFEQLPEDVQKAIIATPWKDKLAQIANKHNLHIDQEGHLGEETVIVMFGLDHPDNLAYNIAEHVEVSEEEAEAIAEDLNNEIFLKIRESLKKVIEKRGNEGEEENGKSGSLESGLLSKKTEETKEEEILNREDILRDIEDKEHHNLPVINKTEQHLEIRPTNDLVSKTPNLPNTQQDFQKIKINIGQTTPTSSKTSPNIEQKPPESRFKINNYESDASKKTPEQTAIIRTMKSDIFKEKMSGTVSLPKETVEVNDLLPPIKKDSTKIIDPYREIPR